MYKFIGLAMMGIFAMMIIPGNFNPVSGEQHFYGAATIQKLDAAGNEVFTQTVHNQLTDTGEDFLLDQAFQDTIANADNVQIGAICVTDAALPGTAPAREALTSADFDTSNTLDDQDVCEEDTSVGTSAGQAIIGPLTFASGADNVDDGDIIDTIGICQNDATDDLAFASCAGEGILFAIIEVSNTTLNSGETVNITYTFDITSASS